MRGNKEKRILTDKLKRLGYRHDRNRGSHEIWTDGKNTFSVNLELNRMVYKRLVKEIDRAKKNSPCGGQGL